MVSVANAVVSFFDLLEAEGRELERNAARAIGLYTPQIKASALKLGAAVGLFLAAGLMLAASGALGLWGSYLTFLETQTPAVAAFSTASVALITAIALGGIALWLNK